MKVLIIEDDRLLAEALQTLLERKGFEAEVVYDGEDGADYAETGVYDLLILDVMMPKLDGYRVARHVRARRVSTPILMLTAKGEVRDRVEGLNAGADYYLTKPFDNAELLACVNALLRRYGDQIDVLRYGNTSLDLSGYTLYTDAASVRLSAKEFNVMRLLMQFQGRSVRKDVLLTRVWGYDSNAVNGRTNNRDHRQQECRGIHHKIHRLSPKNTELPFELVEWDQERRATKEMKGYYVYRQIQQLREKGFRKSAVTRRLGLDWRTVDRLDADAYEWAHEQVCPTSLLEEYDGAILSRLREYPTMSAAQVSDWLKEHYAQGFSERTVSRYVSQLREKHDMKKTASPREYEAVPEFPPGKQLQVDFGEKWMETVEGSRIKVRFAAFVLSHSRQKYVEFQSRPFTASDLVRACRNSFRYYGGLPRELVFDQDSVVVVSENCGDVIHTYEFEKLRQELKLSIYVCRGSEETVTPCHTGPIRRRRRSASSRRTVPFISAPFSASQSASTSFRPAGDIS